jgi:hypothetical protein
MAVLSVTYDLHDSDSADYTELHDTLRAFPAWCHVCESTWLIQADLTPIQAHRHLSRFLRSKDRVFITPVIVDWGWAEQGLPERMVGWLRRHLGSKDGILV